MLDFIFLTPLGAYIPSAYPLILISRFLITVTSLLKFRNTPAAQLPVSQPVMCLICYSFPLVNTFFEKKLKKYKKNHNLLIFRSSSFVFIFDNRFLSALLKSLYKLFSTFILIKKSQQIKKLIFF